ncbi:MAG: LamG domain-containing protein, partial [candidate division KSB1 bacterium]|nr:LamG domain-containing protein [candidate division KSB1 bacterium]
MKPSTLIATLMVITLLVGCSETLQLSPINDRILLRYRSDAVKNNPNILSKIEEKNVESIDYPSSSSEFIFRVARLNGLSSYIKVENFDIETFDANLARGLTIEAWFSPEEVTGQRPLFWFEDAFLLTIDDGKLVGKVKASNGSNFDEFLVLRTDTALIEPDKWYFVAFRDSLNVHQPPDVVHHLDLWVNHQKITTTTA